MRLKSRQPTAAVSPRATEGHSAPQQREVRNDRDALPPGHRFVVVGQELDLKENEQRKRPDDQADQRDQSQHGAVQSGADLARPGKKLHEDVARKLTAQAGPDVLVGDLRQKLCVEDADFVGQHREVQQHISVHDQEYRRSQYEEAEEGQLDAKERKLDRALEQEIAVRHAADGDDQIKQHEQIAEPQPRADIGGIDHRVAQRFEVLRLAGDRRKRRSRLRLVGRLRVLGHGAPPRRSIQPSGDRATGARLPRRILPLTPSNALAPAR